MVNDEEILGGFASLHQAMTDGFDRLSDRLSKELQTLRSEILDVRNDVARLETRMLGVSMTSRRYSTDSSNGSPCSKNA